MNPSISVRNFVGGLLGGFVGILSAWYINPVALPFGVLLGVVVGWWHSEVWQSVASAHQRAKAATGGFLQIIDESITRLGKSLGMPRWVTGFFRWLLVKAVIGGTMAIIMSPAKFCRWLRMHPMNVGGAISLVVYFATIAGTAFGVWKLTIACGQNTGNALAASLVSIFIGMGGMVAYTWRDNTEIGDMSRYYREWEILSHYGPIGLTFYLVASYVRYTIGVALFVAVVLPWSFSTFTMGFLLIYPTVLALGFLSSLYRFVNRTGHWLCFGVTLATTAVSWLVFQHSFGNELVAWTAALLTGIASGALTELVRQPLVAFYEGTRVGVWLQSSAWDKIVSGKEDGDTFMDIIFERVAGFWFQQYRPARVFRAICFGLPIAR